ncbi:MAG: glycosyltransferase family 9 protein [Candidatus Omnitrophica bacterium]|nr:glycosyltransferase family 9 protein [Candidatus Omnitrophota bacterium]
MSENSTPRILVVNPYGIGDVLFTTPLIQALRDKYPGAFIGMLVGSRTAEVVRDNPCISEIFVYDKDRYRSLPWWKAFRYFLNLIMTLRRQRFNTLIDFSLGAEYSAIALFLLGIKKRIGFNMKGRGRFLNKKVRLKGFHTKPVASYYLELGKFLGLDPDAVEEQDGELKLYLSKEGLRRAEEFLRKEGLDQDQKLVLMIPGGGASWGANAWYKQWPAESFARLADLLVEGYGAQIIITGDEKDRPIVERAAQAMKAKPVVSTGLDLGAFSALMSYCRLVVCNDGGPLHVAVSQGISTVSFFGPVDERVYGPYTKDRDHFVFTNPVSCRPCYKHPTFPPCRYEKACLVELNPESVAREARPLLKRRLGD